MEPGSAAQFRSELETLSSPITQFIDDACVIDTGATVPKAHLYLRYLTWCETAGHRPAGDAQFAAELMSLGLGVSSSRLRVEGGREYVFKGIRIADVL